MWYKHMQRSYSTEVSPLCQEVPCFKKVESELSWGKMGRILKH